MVGFALLGRVIVGLWGFPLLAATVIGLGNGLSSVADGIIAVALLVLSSWASYKSVTMGVTLTANQFRYRGFFRTVVLPRHEIERFDHPEDADNRVDVFSDYLTNPVVHVRGRELAMPLMACMFWTWGRGRKIDDLNRLLGSAQT